jgi:hypothetical protein
MSFPSFISLLQRRQLFFAKLSTLAERDPYEGKYPEIVMSDYAARYRPQFDRNRLADGEKFARAIERKNRNTRAMNCWHMSEAESAAMWKLYSGEHGLALRTTLGGLKKSLMNEERPVYAYEVEYFDSVGASTPMLPFHSGYAKRKSFAHERELRACVFVPEGDNSTGTYVNVNLDALIEAVLIAPEGEPWLHEVVEGVIKAYGFCKPVLKSDLYGEAVW